MDSTKLPQYFVKKASLAFGRRLGMFKFVVERVTLDKLEAVVDSSSCPRIESWQWQLVP